MFYLLPSYTENILLYFFFILCVWNILACVNIQGWSYCKCRREGADYFCRYRSVFTAFHFLIYCTNICEFCFTVVMIKVRHNSAYTVVRVMNAVNGKGRFSGSCSSETRAVPNIRFVFASAPNSGPNRLFVFGRIVLSRPNTNSAWGSLLESSQHWTASSVMIAFDVCRLSTGVSWRQMYHSWVDIIIIDQYVMDLW